MGRDFQVRALTLGQARALYCERLTVDFPPDEVKSFAIIERAMRRGQYACYAAMDGAEILAYAWFYCRNRDGHLWGLVDYFAVRRDLRGQGVGSRFLQALIDGPVREMNCALLEVDDPDTAGDDASRVLMNRRLRFYLRNGLTETGVTARVFGVDFRILALPAKDMPTRAEAGYIYDALYRGMLPDHLYHTKVKIK